MVDLFDCARRLVEDVLELSISLLELSTELHIHVRSDGCPYYKCDPQEPIANIESYLHVARESRQYDCIVGRLLDLRSKNEHDQAD